MPGLFARGKVPEKWSSAERANAKEKKLSAKSQEPALQGSMGIAPTHKDAAKRQKRCPRGTCGTAARTLSQAKLLSPAFYEPL
jgi:hypothetical protein